MLYNWDLAIINTFKLVFARHEIPEALQSDSPQGNLLTSERTISLTTKLVAPTFLPAMDRQNEQCRPSSNSWSPLHCTPVLWSYSTALVWKISSWTTYGQEHKVHGPSNNWEFSTTMVISTRGSDGATTTSSKNRKLIMIVITKLGSYLRSLITLTSGSLQMDIVQRDEQSPQQTLLIPTSWK